MCCWCRPGGPTELRSRCVQKTAQLNGGHPVNTLTHQQTALLDALFTRPDAEWTTASAGTNLPLFHGARGLQAYRVNGHAQAERSLLATYSVLAQLLGSESFALLARDFWHHHPPVQGDLAQWGGDLPAFLHSNAQLTAEPYLSDVARVEWALHCCALAADHPADTGSLVLLTTVDPAVLTLRLASGLAVVTSAYPVASIVMAHQDATPALDQAGRMLRDGVAETALVWRQNFKPRVTACSAAVAALLQHLLTGSDLLTALENAPALDFAEWLPGAVQCGLVVGAAAQ